METAQHVVRLGEALGGGAGEPLKGGGAVPLGADAVEQGAGEVELGPIVAESGGAAVAVEGGGRVAGHAPAVLEAAAPHVDGRRMTGGGGGGEPAERVGVTRIQQELGVQRLGLGEAVAGETLEPNGSVGAGEVALALVVGEAEPG